MKSSLKNLASCYPEIEAGGYTRSDGTIEFYQRIRSLISQDSQLLDIGAGRGAQILDTSSPYRSQLSRLQGSANRIVGVDVDPAVLTNPYLDEAHIISATTPLPFEDSTFDLIYSDWVLEHVENPEYFAPEVLRVLKPGGWFCARTPNRFGFIGLATNLVPNRLHKRILKHLQPERESVDVFPTTYLLNTRSAIRHYFPKCDWEDFTYIVNPEPSYVQSSKLAMRLLQLYWRLTPECMHTVLNVFLRKRTTSHRP